ncbi:flagellar basal body L-ring protein FlgH [Aromatoleum sp.]|uniref:flagellar basal body L-ring protein FlgH n=1 Tax=Aromatoleum sp. TaxID=2307007 RepID=UPI002FC74BED
MRLLAAIAALTLSACNTTMPGVAPASAMDPRLAMPLAPKKGQAGGVFAADAPWSLTSDARAFRPGDVLTVVLQETTQATKKADTRFAKDSSVSLSPAAIGNKTFDIGASFDGEREFAGAASATQQNALRGSITVVVHAVLPNGLLRVEGEKSLLLNQGEEFIHLSGYVRAADIDTDNRVSSQRVANARIGYSGRGALADANSAGWLTRLFNSPWMPF